MNSTITKEKLDSYFLITGEALSKAKVAFDENRMLEAEDFFDMAERYFNDAKYFLEKKEDMVLAFAALNYAHGWLDCGVRTRIFNVKDDKLFTVR